MTGRQDIDYFRIGLFVLLGLILMILTIMAFSSMQLFAKRLYFETYFNESVEGLSIGSPVKYRGIEIGQVKDIELVASVYPEANDDSNTAYGRYIYVLMAINPDFLPNTSSDRVAQILRREVHEGLRTTLTIQGLTGGTFLSLTFVDPSQSKELPIDWRPNNYYIPSSISTLARLSDSLGKILNSLQTVNFQHISDQTELLLGHLNRLVNETNSNLVHVSGNLNELTDMIKENPSALIFSHPQAIQPSHL